jgi:hypothetical protein
VSALHAESGGAGVTEETVVRSSTPVEVIHALEIAQRLADEGVPQIVFFAFGVSEETAGEIHQKAQAFVQGRIPGFIVGSPTSKRERHWLEDVVCFAHHHEYISEGQAALLLSLDRLTLRGIKQAWIMANDPPAKEEREEDAG